MPRGIVKDTLDRYKKWRAKFKPDHWAWVVEATQDIASEKMMHYQADYQAILNAVKDVLQRYPSEAFRTQEYMWYALKLYHCVRVYSSRSLTKCANAATMYFAVMGLNVEAMYSIAGRLGVHVDPLEEIAAGLGIMVGRPKVFNLVDGPAAVATTDPQVVVAVPLESPVYVEGVRVTAENPPGSGSTLYFTVYLVHSGGRTALTDVVSVAEGQVFDDWLRWLLDSVPDGVELKGVEVEAWVSQQPQQGLEPSIALRVTGTRLAR